MQKQRKINGHVFPNYRTFLLQHYSKNQDLVHSGKLWQLATQATSIVFETVQVEYSLGDCFTWIAYLKQS